MSRSNSFRAEPITFMRRMVVTLMLLTAGAILTGCNTQSIIEDESVDTQASDKLMVVDCLLPGQIRKLGANARYLTARRPIKTTALNCEIRGGEYVAFDRADFATALKVWLDQAKTGDPEAQTYVGEVYEKGLGLDPDYEVAAVWYKRAAEQGFTRAQINLGNLYEKGLGVKEDPIEALNWYRKASGLGDDNLQYASTVVASEVLQKELASIESEVQDLRRYKNQTEEEKKAAERRAAELAEQAIKQEALRLAKASQIPPPSIQILDPPIALTRSGLTVTLRNAVKKREVAGRVISSAGLNSFYVNGEEVEVDEHSLFFVDVPIKGIKTDVEMKAVDRENQQVSFDFSMFLDKNAAGPSVQKFEYDPATGTAKFGDVNFGRYYALVIGNQDYKYYAQLETPGDDARKVAELLSSRYGFKSKLILNANRYELLSALNEMREMLTENDNLLIYYAGHGELDEDNRRGFWLPVDAEPGNTANWLSTVSISDQLNTIKAKQILVVADSCYAGTLSNASVARQSSGSIQDLDEEWLEVMVDAKARTVLTSGGVRPVLDSGGGEHSVFARAFINTLETNSKLLEGNRLFLSVLSEVRERSRKFGLDQVPDYGSIQFAGHEAGEFFLVPAS